MNVTLDQTTLPVLTSSDVVVVGGSLAGIAAALVFARNERKGVLVEPRTYLGREITATLRPWIGLDEAAMADLPALIENCIKASGTPVINGEIALQPEKLKTGLEDLLLDAGVKLLYSSLPVGLVRNTETGLGLVIGNKSGRQILSCGLVIDASESATVARLSQ